MTLPGSVSRHFLRLALLPLALAATSGRAQSPQPARQPVQVAHAELKQLAPSVITTGQVRSRAGADLAAGVAGRLSWVAEPGTRVAQNAVVARIDTDELALQKAEQAARVLRGELAVRSAQREVERLQNAGNAVSRLQLNQAEDARDLAKAELEIARATLRQTEERLARAELRAPFAGVVSERLRRAGEEVARGEAVARLHDTEHLEIRLFLPLRHVRAIAPGSTVHVLQGETYAAAAVRAVVPVGDTRSQSFEALVDVPAINPPLAVGHTVRVELPLQAPKEALAVPRDAVVIRAEGLAVYRVRDGAKAERVPVTTGVAQGDWVAVEGSLAPRDPVVVRGAESLHDGDPVVIVKTQGANPA